MSMPTRIVLLACGSFNPITNMHLRMFGKNLIEARSYLSDHAVFFYVNTVIRNRLKDQCDTSFH